MKSEAWIKGRLEYVTESKLRWQNELDFLPEGFGRIPLERIVAILQAEERLLIQILEDAE